MEGGRGGKENERMKEWNSGRGEGGVKGQSRQGEGTGTNTRLTVCCLPRPFSSPSFFRFFETQLALQHSNTALYCARALHTAHSPLSDSD